MSANGTDRNPKEETSVLQRHDIAMAVNAFLASNAPERSGRESARLERRQHIRRMELRYWPLLDEMLTAALRRRRGALELTDEERLFADLGLMDARMVDDPAAAKRTIAKLMTEVTAKGLSGCYYFSEWLAFRQQQSQIASDLDWAGQTGKNNYAGQLDEARRRVLTRLSNYMTGLPGVSLEMIEVMRSGDLDKAVIASGISALRNPGRKSFLRRHRLWNLREQILSKARARADNPGVIKLFEMLNEVYLREWRSSHDAYMHDTGTQVVAQGAATGAVDAFNPETDAVLRSARRMRMRMRLLEAVDGSDDLGVILYGDGPRMTRPLLSTLTALAQTFDRSLSEPPTMVIVPGGGRGCFAWEAGCLLLALRPLTSPEDSLATALASMRMLTDRFNGGGALRRAYEEAFPGSVFSVDFPADYRAWLCRLTKGDISALNADRRAFFRERIGPSLSGPLLPANLRTVGPQTMSALARRLEKQMASGEGDVNLHRRLAAIYWRQDEVEAAAQQFSAAMQVAPEDGETLFAAGMFMRSRDDVAAANECFRYGAERSAGTMWGVYCKDALEGLF